jgi:hypothetical protein
MTMGLLEAAGVVRELGGCRLRALALTLVSLLN